MENNGRSWDNGNNVTKRNPQEILKIETSCSDSKAKTLVHPYLELSREYVLFIFIFLQEIVI